jgi:hypothetical protein
MEKLRQIKEKKIDRVLQASAENLDPYTKAHLDDTAMQIDRALKAYYVYKQL